MQIAAETFAIRYRLRFRHAPPGRRHNLDDLYSRVRAARSSCQRSTASQAIRPPTSRSSPWTLHAEGLVPVARSHAELVGGGLRGRVRSPRRQDHDARGARATSFAGLATTIVPWLVGGGYAGAASAVRSRELSPPSTTRSAATRGPSRPVGPAPERNGLLAATGLPRPGGVAIARAARRRAPPGATANIA